MRRVRLVGVATATFSKSPTCAASALYRPYDCVVCRLVARDAPVVNEHDAVGIGDVRRRLQQQPVDDAEHRAVRADAQRERAGDGGGESQAASHAAEREAEVVAERVDHNSVHSGVARWTVPSGKALDSAVV